MSARYQIRFRPFLNDVQNRQVIEADGTSCVERVVGNSSAIPSGNNLTVLQALVNNTVQPNTAQLNGLVAYLAAIQAGTVTTTVETAISAL